MTDKPDNPEQGGGSGHKDDAKATLQRVCGNLRNDGYLVPISVLTRAIEFLRPSEFGEYCSTPEPKGYNEWIDTYKVTNGPYAYSNADMVMSFNAGQENPKANALEWCMIDKLVRSAFLYERETALAARIAELEAQIAAWEAIEKGRV